MTNYAVISDIHGNAENLLAALTVAQNNHADYILILGDLLNHGPRNGVPKGYDPLKIAEILNEIKEQTIIVRGNCDSEVDTMLIDTNISNTSNTLVINGHKCFMTHGHIYKEQDCIKLGLAANDIFLSGHTHQSVLKKNDQGVIIFNPGSITFPKGTNEKTLGIITDNKILLLNINGEIINSLSLDAV